VGGQLLGANLGGFVGGAAMVVAASIVQSRPGAPPLIVCYTPAFWLLVPGGIGVEGLTNIAQESPAAGLDDLLTMIMTMVSIALGMLLGLVLAGRRRAFELLG
jgi:uncharacterized membrane protein YjjB (DUF3815 family)